MQSVGFNQSIVSAAQPFEQQHHRTIYYDTVPYGYPRSSLIPGTTTSSVETLQTCCKPGQYEVQVQNSTCDSHCFDHLSDDGSGFTNTCSRCPETVVVMSRPLWSRYPYSHYPYGRRRSSSGRRRHPWIPRGYGGSSSSPGRRH